MREVYPALLEDRAIGHNARASASARWTCPAVFNELCPTIDRLNGLAYVVLERGEIKDYVFSARCFVHAATVLRQERFINPCRLAQEKYLA